MRLKKTEASLEKANWEISQAEVHVWRVAKAQAAREFTEVECQTEEEPKLSRETQTEEEEEEEASVTPGEVKEPIIVESAPAQITRPCIVRCDQSVQVEIEFVY